MSELELIHRGKVRDVYRDPSSLYLVATDRISAFDVILPTPIPAKGIALTQLSRFWFEQLPPDIPHHVKSFENPFPELQPHWTGRVTACRPLEPVKMECVVRGYLAGSAWKEYQQSGSVQGWNLPDGLPESARLPTPLFTPTTKADQGHDLPLTEPEAIALVGAPTYETLRDRTLHLYQWAHDIARHQGILIADSKLEFGKEGESLVLIDELFTSDSSRFWPADAYEPGRSQHSFDKQFVRDYLLSLPDWNRQPPGPELPDDIVQQTRARYFDVYERLTGKKLNH